MMLMLML